jgi:predicted nucleic acid-binding protein
MIWYFDASALVKRYVAERGSDQVNRAIEEAEALGTVVVSRAEIVAALAKARRLGVLDEEQALAGRRLFSQDWPHLIRVQLTDALVDRAGALAWNHGLRGYDAVHLAAATTWRDSIDDAVTLATFDRRLWAAAEKEGLVPFPSDLTVAVDSA